VRRRDFIKVIAGSTAGWPILASAQQRPPKIPRIGIIDDAPIWDHFRRGLRELGYVEGQDIKIEYRSSGGDPSRLAAVATDLANLSVDVIATYGSAPTRAARQATTTIPIVMISVGDPIKAGFVQSLARPGGNITGNTILGTEMAGKRIQVLKELIPSASRVAFLWNPNNASHLAYLGEWRALAPMLSIEALFVEVGQPEQFEPAFVAMMGKHPDALSVTADPFHVAQVGWIIDFVAKNRLPTIYVVKENVFAGGLMSYGPNLPDLFRRAAGHVHKILQGGKPADLPVEQPTQFELAINLKTAKALGLTLSPSLLTTADDVIE
jgi:putative tryptophan/tyrosine transport system substrate-binding protein